MVKGKPNQDHVLASQPTVTIHLLSFAALSIQYHSNVAKDL